MSEVKLEDIVSLCKRRGFIYQGSEVYGGLAGTWDYGPLGVALKRNIMELWWKTFVTERGDMYGVDAAILMNQKVWKASGHVDTFTDPLIECNNCHNRFRVDKTIDNMDNYVSFVNAVAALLTESAKAKGDVILSDIEKINKISSGLEGDLKELIDENKKNDFKHDVMAKKSAYKLEVMSISKFIAVLEDAMSFQGSLPRDYFNQFQECEVCKHKDWNEPRKFNLMFKTNVGPVDDESSVSYLRPETAQGIFTNYKNVVDSFYPDVPFGIAQQGKAFRNEISPRDFVFRSREFEQMEVEYFVHEKEWEKAFEQWVKDIDAFLQNLGIDAKKVEKKEVPEEDRAHYSKRTIDFEFDFPHGKDELLGLAYRTDFDLQNIQKASGKNMEYRPKDGSAAFVPHVIEPSFGVERAIMALLCSAYTTDEVGGEKRTVLKLPAHLAPVKVAVSPLLKNKPELVKKAREVYDSLKKEFGSVMWDDNGNIGKRYRRQDEIGTPYCVTIDFQTLDDNTVTVRNRDTTDQERVKIDVLSQSISL